MIGKIIPCRSKRATRAATFAARSNYIAARASRIETSNVLGDWRDGARQMSDVAQWVPTRSRPDIHIVITFNPLETPDDDTFFAAARDVLTHFGADGHQAIFGMHKTKNVTHVHVLLNSVHPANFSTLPRSQDWMRLERACRIVELKNGWPADRGRFDWDEIDGEFKSVRKPEVHWTAKQAARAAGRRRGDIVAEKRAARTVLAPLAACLGHDGSDALRQFLADAADWSDFHQRLEAAGLSLLKVRGGARIELLPGGTDSPAMTAGQIGRNFSMPALVQRFGNFIPALEQERPITANEALERLRRIAPGLPVPDPRVELALEAGLLREDRDRKERAANLVSLTHTLKAEEEQERAEAEEAGLLNLPQSFAAVLLRAHAAHSDRLRRNAAAENRTFVHRADVSDADPDALRRRRVARMQGPWWSSGPLFLEGFDHTTGRQLLEQQLALEHPDVVNQPIQLSKTATLLARWCDGAQLRGFDILEDHENNVPPRQARGSVSGWTILRSNGSSRETVLYASCVSDALKAFRLDLPEVGLILCAPDEILWKGAMALQNFTQDQPIAIFETGCDPARESLLKHHLPLAAVIPITDTISQHEQPETAVPNTGEMLHEIEHLARTQAVAARTAEASANAITEFMVSESDTVKNLELSPEPVNCETVSTPAADDKSASDSATTMLLSLPHPTKSESSNTVHNTQTRIRPAFGLSDILNVPQRPTQPRDAEKRLAVRDLENIDYGWCVQMLSRVEPVSTGCIYPISDKLVILPTRDASGNLVGFMRCPLDASAKAELVRGSKPGWIAVGAIDAALCLVIATPNDLGAVLKSRWSEPLWIICPPTNGRIVSTEFAEVIGDRKPTLFLTGNDVTTESDLIDLVPSAPRIQFLSHRIGERTTEHPAAESPVLSPFPDMHAIPEPSPWD